MLFLDFVHPKVILPVSMQRNHEEFIQSIQRYLLMEFRSNIRKLLDQLLRRIEVGLKREPYYGMLIM